MTKAQDKWLDIRSVLIVIALLVSIYLTVAPGFGFWFMGAQSLNDFALGVPALAMFLVIVAFWWSFGPALLLCMGNVFFFMC